MCVGYFYFLIVKDFKFMCVYAKDWRDGMSTVAHSMSLASSSFNFYYFYHVFFTSFNLFYFTITLLSSRVHSQTIMGVSHAQMMC